MRRWRWQFGNINSGLSSLPSCWWTKGAATNVTCSHGATKTTSTTRSQFKLREKKSPIVKAVKGCWFPFSLNFISLSNFFWGTILGSVLFHWTLFSEISDQQASVFLFCARCCRILLNTFYSWVFGFIYPPIEHCSRDCGHPVGFGIWAQSVRSNEKQLTEKFLKETHRKI